MSAPREMNDTPASHEKPSTFPFDVVMLKRTASEATCLPADLKRIRVMAAYTLSAMYDPLVVAEETEYRVVHTTPPGHETQIEMAARSRSYNGGETDKKKIGFEDPMPLMRPLGDGK